MSLLRTPSVLESVQVTQQALGANKAESHQCVAWILALTFWKFQVNNLKERLRVLLHMSGFEVVTKRIPAVSIPRRLRPQRRLPMRCRGCYVVDQHFCIHVLVCFIHPSFYYPFSFHATQTAALRPLCFYFTTSLTAASLGCAVYLTPSMV